MNIQKATEKASNLLKDETYQTIPSVSDPEAKTGYKSSTESFTGYKSHLAITEEHIITAIDYQKNDKFKEKKKNGIKSNLRMRN